MIIDFNIYTFLTLFFVTILAAFIIYKRKERKVKFFVIAILILYILLLLPIPIFIGFLKEKNSALKMFVFGFCTSLFIELAQLLLNVLTKYPVHLCDVDDLILNSMGVILGIIVFYMIKAINLVKN